MMELLNKLLSVDAPAGTTLQSAAPALRGVFPLWLAIVLFVLATAGAVYCYSREQVAISGIRRGILIFLRVAVIGMILLLLLRPVLVAEFRGERPQEIVLLLDNSQSMKLQDRRVSPADKMRVAIAKNLVPLTTSITDSKLLADLPAGLSANPERAEIVRAVLEHPGLQIIDGLKKHGPLRVYTFGQQLRRVSDDGEESFTRQVLAEFTANDARTALADAINEVLLSKDGELPGAIVVITDGNDNASKVPLEEVAQECARVKAPLHFWGAGTSEGGTLLFKDVLVPETIFYEDTVSVPVRWRARGIRQGTAVITLSLGGKVVAQKEVAVREGEDFREVLVFTPSKKGTEREEKTEMVATIQLKGNADYRDELKRPIHVIDRRVKVLYVENNPRWEFKFLQPVLLRDRRVEAAFVLLGGDPRLMQAGPPFLPSFPTRDKLFAFDLLIIGDVPASWFDTERLTAIQDFVREGGGLVMIAGRHHAPASYAGSPLAEVLPVEFLPQKATLDPDSRPQAWNPVLTTLGERSDMMALADTPEDNLKTWRSLPGFHWHYPVTKLRPGAMTLLAHPTAKLGEQRDQPMPLVAVHYYGKGQVMFMGVEETWRWRANAQEKYFPRFWGQVVYQLGLPHLLGSSKKVQVTLEQSEAILDTSGHVRARLFDAEFRPLKEDRITAELEHLDAKPGQERIRRIVLEAVPGQPGDFRSPLVFDSEGRFELRLSGPEPATLQYRVSRPPRHELELLGMAEDQLREAARVSGGKFYREEDLHQLLSNIQMRKTPFTHRQEVLLWGPLAMILFVGLITAEWLVRKFSNLS